MSILNCRGKACPEPVLMTKNFLERNPGAESVHVQVDNAAASENVKRFLESRGFSTFVEKEGGDFHVKGAREGGLPAEESLPQKSPKAGEEGRLLIMIANDRIGTGDAVLGSLLMKNFINTLNEMGESLWRIICVNEGVKLCLKDAHTIDGLEKLENRGVSILVCGTCLEHYGLMNQKAVGVTTNMLDIVTSLELAERVINL